MFRPCRYSRRARRAVAAITLASTIAALAMADPGLPLFESNDILALTLEAEFSRISRDRDEKTSPYRPAVLSYMVDDAEKRSIALQLKTRGDFRLKEENCSFLAFMLRFTRSETAGTPFAGQQDVPLVTHCRRKAYYEQYVLREYLAYRSYNLMTDNSLRVRLARIDYLEAGGDPITTRYAFMVEHFDSMAQRLGANIVPVDALDTTNARAFDFAMLYVFQLLIGNTDFSVVAGHNILLLQKQEGWIIPVPFDLDFSGAVDTRYATTPEFLARRGRHSVTIRRYRGFCEPAGVLDQVFDRYRERKAQLYALYSEQRGLTKYSRNKTARYLDSFFALLDNPDKLQSRIALGCRDELDLPQ